MNESIKTKAIVVEYDLPHPPAKVWRALTEPALLASWLMPNDFAAEVGRRFTFKAEPIREWDGTVECQVLEVEPQQRLVYSWQGGVGDWRIDTVVRWALTATARGTLLRLEHSGFLPIHAAAFDGMGNGWRGKIARRLEDILAAAS
jgi:uncharacterized protein YndB with AHSA1/START domain